MEVLYLLLPIAILVAVVIAMFFIWSVKSGQYEDLDGSAHRILMDDDGPNKGVKSTQEKKRKQNR